MDKNGRPRKDYQVRSHSLQISITPDMQEWLQDVKRLHGFRTDSTAGYELLKKIMDGEMVFKEDKITVAGTFIKKLRSSWIWANKEFSG